MIESRSVLTTLLRGLDRLCLIDPHLGQIDQIDQIDHDLDHLDPNLLLGDVLQDCTVQIQPGKRVPDHADCTAPTR